LQFQCSSASRKFLNDDRLYHPNEFVGFSALQRAENFSSDAADVDRCRRRVSVLFSEPKISQRVVAGAAED